jgi:hypothetical protein
MGTVLVFTMDSAALGLAALGCGMSHEHGALCFSPEDLATLENAVEVHAVALRCSFSPWILLC